MSRKKMLAEGNIGNGDIDFTPPAICTNNDVSFATQQYLERYRLMPSNNGSNKPGKKYFVLKFFKINYR